MSDAAKRLRLVLGKFADRNLSNPLFGDESLCDMDRHLGYLYDRAYAQGRGMRAPRSGGLGASQLTAVNWLGHMRELFPKECLEIVERDAISKFGMTELLTDPKVLEQVEPSEDILKVLVQFRSRIAPRARDQARRLIDAVVRNLYQKLATSVRPALTGALDRNRRSRLKVASNLDAWKTVRQNLKNYDPATGTLGIEKVVFSARKRRHAAWKIILLLDQSGSMLDSVIYGAIMGGIFASLPEIDLRLVVFDTQVVDITEIAHDPVEVLFSVNLGGGTLIEKAVGYASRLVTSPRNTICVLVSDFYEGGPVPLLCSRVKDMVDSGVKMLGLAALGSDGTPEYDKQTAKQLVALGMPIAAMTPLKLAEWIAGHVRGAAS